MFFVEMRGCSHTGVPTSDSVTSAQNGADWESGVPESWLKHTASIYCRDNPGKFLQKDEDGEDGTELVLRHESRDPRAPERLEDQIHEAADGHQGSCGGFLGAGGSEGPKPEGGNGAIRDCTEGQGLGDRSGDEGGDCFPSTNAPGFCKVIEIYHSKEVDRCKGSSWRQLCQVAQGWCSHLVSWQRAACPGVCGL